MLRVYIALSIALSLCSVISNSGFSTSLQTRKRTVELLKFTVSGISSSRKPFSSVLDGVSVVAVSVVDDD